MLTPVTDTVSTAPFPSTTDSVLVNVPYATGLNVTVIVQLPPALRVAGQLFLCVIDGSPLKLIPATATDDDVLLLTVTVWLGLSPMVYPLLKVTADGVKLKTPVAEELDPIPVSDTFCAPVERVIVSEPVLVPATDGVKVTETLQFPPAAIDEPHVVVVV